MYTAAGKREETSPLRLPNYTGGNVPAKDGHFYHRQGRLTKSQRELNGRVIDRGEGTLCTRKGENIKAHRGSVCGLRDKMALASKGSKPHKFVYTNRQVDHAIDNPVGVHVPARCANHGVGGRSGGLARGLRG